MKRYLQLGAVAVVMVLLLAACGSEGEDSVDTYGTNNLTADVESGDSPSSSDSENETAEEEEMEDEDEPDDPIIISSDEPEEESEEGDEETRSTGCC